MNIETAIAQRPMRYGLTSCLISPSPEQGFAATVYIANMVFMKRVPHKG